MTQSVNHLQPLRQLLIRIGVIKTISEVASELPDQRSIDITAKRLAGLDLHYDLTVLIIPSRGLWVGARQKETRDVHSRMVRALQLSGIEVVDPLPELERGKNPLSVSFPQ